MSGPLVIAAVCLVVWGALVLFVVRRVNRTGHRPAPTQDDAGCGRCGYLLRGSSGVTCPECGAEIARVGLRFPSPWRAFVAQHAMLGLWTLLWGVGVLYLLPLGVTHLTPQQWRDSIGLRLYDPRQDPGAPPELAIEGSGVWASAMRLGAGSVPLRIDRLTISGGRLAREHARTTLETDASFSSHRWAGQDRGPLTRDAIEAWWTSHFSGDDPTLRPARVDALWSALQEMSQGALPAQRRDIDYAGTTQWRDRQGRSTISPYMVRTITVAAVAAWLFGCIRLRQRQRRGINAPMYV